MIRVLLDACLLIKGNVCNTLLDFGKQRLIAAHWTPEIGAQFIRNWAKRRVSDEAARRKLNGLPPLANEELLVWTDEARKRASARLDKLAMLAPEWRIPGWDLQASMAAHPKATICASGPGGEVIHGGDYEVALAAITLTRAFPRDEIWLATENIHHLPSSALSKYGVWSIHQSVLIEELYNMRPKALEASLALTMSQTGQGAQKKIGKAEMIRIIADPQQFGSQPVATALAKSWNLPTPAASTATRSRKRLGRT